MRTKVNLVLLTLILGGLWSCQKQIQPQHHNNDYLQLWYKQPATEWEEALPVGNGRLGAMIFGGIDTIQIQLNEESVWAGMKQNNTNPEALKNLPALRKLLFEDKNKEALSMANKYIMSENKNIRSYQTLGDLFIYNKNKGEITDYKRSLELANGVSKVEWRSNGHLYQQETFASAPDDVIMIHLKTEDPDGLNCELAMSRVQDAKVTTIANNQIRLAGYIIDEPNPTRDKGGKHMGFEGRLKVLDTDGTINTKGNSLEIKGASKLTLAVTAATDYNRDILNFDRSINPSSKIDNILNKIDNTSYASIKNTHVNEHRSIFNRVDFEITQTLKDTIPTDVRLSQVKNDMDDFHLVELYFQYGRYLLMGSSRAPGVLPANLQGIWNEHINAPWNSDFHVNINLQMNYWPAEVCNLSETSLPMAEFFHQIHKTSGIEAAKMYGCDGWTMHHVTDPFGRTGIVGGIVHGMFPLGGGWVCFPIWRHYEFTNDTKYLKEIIWPMLKGNATFIMDFLTEDPDGYLVTSPSYSP